MRARGSRSTSASSRSPRPGGAAPARTGTSSKGSGASASRSAETAPATAAAACSGTQVGWSSRIPRHRHLAREANLYRNRPVGDVMTVLQQRSLKAAILITGALVALLGPLVIERDTQRIDDAIRKAEASADESQRILNRTKDPFEKFSAASALAEQQIRRLRSARAAEGVALKGEIR